MHSERRPPSTTPSHGVPTIKVTLLVALVILLTSLSTISARSAFGFWGDIKENVEIDEVRDRGNHHNLAKVTRKIPESKASRWKEAVNYLIKYGYLENCTPKNRKSMREYHKKNFKTNQNVSENKINKHKNRLNHVKRRKHKTLNPSNKVEKIAIDKNLYTNKSTLPHCTKKQKTKALIKMQESFHLNVTGFPDTNTIIQMRKLRCGNADSEFHELTDTAIHFAKLNYETFLANETRVSHVKVVKVSELSDDFEHSPTNGSPITISSNNSKNTFSNKKRYPRHVENLDILDHLFEYNGINNESILSQNIFENLEIDRDSVEVRLEQFKKILTKILKSKPNKKVLTPEELEQQREMLKERNLQRRQEEEMAKNAHQLHFINNGDVTNGPILIEVDLAGKTTKITPLVPGSKLSEALIEKHESAASTTTTTTTSGPTLSTANSDVDHELHIRRKRSAFYIPTVEKTDINGKARRLFKISKYDNGSVVPLKWMLLKDETIFKMMDRQTRRSIMSLAFRIWSEVTPLIFVENENGLLVETDIWVVFADGLHVYCEKPFDGKGGEIAHSWSSGDIHFDAEEDFGDDIEDEDAVYLLKVALHEVGHVLGLTHIENESSVMFPIYNSPKDTAQVELTTQDREAIIHLYGPCTEKVDVIFDKIYWSTTANEFKYNTYIIRGNRMWMYLRASQRARCGDPVDLQSNHFLQNNREVFDAYGNLVPGRPVTKVDAFFTMKSETRNIETFFFSGDFIYKINNALYSEILDGWPKKISDVMTSSEPIPTPVDAACFEENSKKIFIFKGEFVWLCETDFGIHGNVCRTKVPFSYIFETNTTEEYPNPVTGHITSVHISFFHKRIFMVVGDMLYNWTLVNRRFVLNPYRPWWKNWHVCKVD